MSMSKPALLLALALASACAHAAEAPAGAGADWASWHAADDVTNLASLQRGARNFMAYCVGCHSLKY